jgi:DNA-binding SARP family transcriptional activator
VNFGLLGPLLVRDTAEIAVRGAIQRIVMGALLLHPRQVITADALKRYLWDGTGSDGVRLPPRITCSGCASRSARLSPPGS